MKRRVVITGMGVISPNGIGTEAFWKATRTGESGVGPITRFDPAELPCAWRARLRISQEDDYVAPKDRPHVSRVTPLAIAATGEALAQAGLDPAAMSREELRGIGVVVGSGGGSSEFTEEQYRLYHTGHWRHCSVYVVPTSTIGTLASEVSMRFGLRGLSHVISTGCTSSTDALGYALRTIQAGALDVMVAGGVDCADRTADPARIYRDADPRVELERPAATRVATVFKRSRRVCDRRRCVVLRTRGARAGRWRAARQFWARSRAMVRHATHTIACA
jgi:3-oxoacyl-[acyl-carrier-protein] synthase II